MEKRIVLMPRTNDHCGQSGYTTIHVIPHQIYFVVMNQTQIVQVIFYFLLFHDGVFESDFYS